MHRNNESSEEGVLESARTLYCGWVLINDVCTTFKFKIRDVRPPAPIRPHTLAELSDDRDRKCAAPIFQSVEGLPI